jgi:hypothetical protein
MLENCWDNLGSPLKFRQNFASLHKPAVQAAKTLCPGPQKGMIREQSDFRPEIPVRIAPAIGLARMIVACGQGFGGIP